MTRERIYLDNAATSWPKPEAVYRAVDQYQRELGAPAGRATYDQAARVDRAVAATRSALAKLFGVNDPRRIVFTYSGTDSLNHAIHGLLSPGDHVVTSVAEHNSILRPLRAAEQQFGISITQVPCNSNGRIAPDNVREALRPETRLVALTHASNVTGAIQPIEEIAAFLREHSARFLVDAAQTLGHMPIDFDRLGCDMLAAPGHKGLLGPLGTGVLILAPGIGEELRSFRQGGTGTQSSDDHQPESLPEKFEAGNHNVPGILGLKAAADWLIVRGLDEVRRHERQLTQQLLDGLAPLEGISVYGPDQADQRVGVVSANVEGYDPQEVAALLDGAHGIQVRAGLHCAPAMHRSLDTLSLGGTFRFSFGPFITPKHVETTLQAMQQIASSRVLL